jgi:hypothetical protein
VLLFSGVDPEKVRDLLGRARYAPRRPLTLWLQAEDAAQLAGNMVKGSAAGVKDAGAFGDVVLCGGGFDRRKPPLPFAEYRVTIPKAGRWTLWARVRYPVGGDLSFGVALASEAVTLEGRQVLGNCGVHGGQWHWTGRGGGSTSRPPGEPIVLDLPQGECVLRVYPREVTGNAATNPRLDALCLTDDPACVPTDAEAAAAMKK